MKLLLLICFCLFGTAAYTAPLAVICTDVAAKAPAECKTLKYDVPKATDLVRKGSTWNDFALVQFSQLLPNDPVNVCADSIAAGTLSTLPYTSADPCKTFTSVAASQLGAEIRPELKLTWTQEAKNVDGSNLTDLAGFRVLYGTNPTALTQTVDIPGDVREYTLTNLAYGTKYYLVLKAFTSGGKESEKSNTDFGTTPAKPSAPTQPVPPVLKVAELTAYDLVKTNDKLSLAAIGTVPVGTACLTGVRAMDLFGVARASVKLNATIKTRPQVVLAKCG